MNFVAPFKVDGKDLHIAISDSSKLGLMRNLKAITKKNIELHDAKVSQISEFIQKLQSETGEVTTESIREERKEKTKNNNEIKGIIFNNLIFTLLLYLIFKIHN